MKSSERIEVLKLAVAMSTVVLQDRNGLANQIIGTDRTNIATAVFDHFFNHFCELVSAEGDAGTADAD